MDAVKKDYDALNDQLVEDLPQLIESSVKVLEKVAGIYMVVSNGFVAEVNESLKKSVKVTVMATGKRNLRPKVSKIFFNFPGLEHLQPRPL